MSDIRDFCPLWGEWEAEKKLGEGSFGAVWKVKRNAIGGRVFYAAVKHISIPKDESETDRLIGEGIFSDEESAVHYYSHMLQSIAEEIDAMHKLQGYTNIVAYEDYQMIPKADGIGYDLFLRMELLQPLTDRIRKGMNVSDVIALGKDIATAIDVLYDHKMIHRDIKPQNIFVNDRGIYKLGDYGTARALGTGATAMSRKGTYNYMSPEIYNGQKADIRADIYSLGLVLYRLLNGNRLPFLPIDAKITSEESDTAVMRRISGETIPAPKNADEELSGIVLKACAFNPEDRYRTPGELIQALEGYKGKTENPVQNDNERTVYEPESLEFKFGSASNNSSALSKDGAKQKETETPEEQRADEKHSEPIREEIREPETKAQKQEKKDKAKPGILPAVIIAIGLIVGGLFAAGILPPKGPEPTATPIITATPTITGTPTETPTPEPMDTPTPEPTDTPTPVPTDTPTPVPTDTPTPEPTDTPTPVPTDTPTPEPTATPTPEPTDTPTPEPTPTPTVKPKPAKIQEARVGDIVQFGHYEQDGNVSNGAEPIEWYVLDSDEQGILLISLYSIDSKPYHTSNSAVNWSTCSLREWMNNDFYHAAFSEEEKAHIVDSHVSPAKDMSSESETILDQGDETIDKVYLLSRDEWLEKYRSILWDSQYDSRTFQTGMIPMSAPRTAQAIKNAGYDRDEWWLRGEVHDKQVDYSYSALSIYNGYQPTRAPLTEYYGIRPMIHIDSIDAVNQ